ncbi:MAG: hypothetical protein JWR77_1955 [Rhizorhabdus sp.]|nr:hypothetical protein [Rhizorhabdus sp.]
MAAEGGASSPEKTLRGQWSTNLLVAAAVAAPILLAGGAGTALLAGSEDPKATPNIWGSQITLVTESATETIAVNPRQGTVSAWLRKVDPRSGQVDAKKAQLMIAAMLSTPGVSTRSADWSINLPLLHADLLPHRAVPVRIGYRLANRRGWVNARITASAYEGCLRGPAGRNCEVWTEPLGAIEREDDMLIWVPAERIIAGGGLNLRLHAEIEARYAANPAPPKPTAPLPDSGATLAIDRIEVGQP